MAEEHPVLFKILLLTPEKFFSIIDIVATDIVVDSFFFGEMSLLVSYFFIKPS